MGEMIFELKTSKYCYKNNFSKKLADIRIEDESEVTTITMNFI